MATLTSRDLAQSTAITPTTLIHIVTTADTSQSIAGSSYKAELQQLSSIFSGGSSSFSGGSGNCITDFYVTNVYGCSPIIVHDTIEMVTGIIRTSGGTGAELNLKDPFGPNGTWSITSDNGGYTSDSCWIFGQPNNGTQIAYQINTYPGEAIGLSINPGGVVDAQFTGKEIVINNNTSNNTLTSGVNRRAIFIGTKNSQINSGVTNTVVIGGSNIIATQNDTLYTDNLNIKTIGSGSSVINLGLDISGNVVTGSTGTGTVNDTYYNSGSGSTITWNVSGQSTNYEATLTTTTTLNLTNVRNGDYGTIILTQDGVGGRTISLGTINGTSGTHRVVNGGGGMVILTSNANAIDILTFTYNGSSMYWTVGNDYT
jgi:hypothetical protein